MGTQKRERQKANRANKIEQERAKEQRDLNKDRFVIIGLVAAAIAGALGLWVLFGGDSETEAPGETVAEPELPLPTAVEPEASEETSTEDETSETSEPTEDQTSETSEPTEDQTSETSEPGEDETSETSEPE